MPKAQTRASGCRPRPSPGVNPSKGPGHMVKCHCGRRLSPRADGGQGRASLPSVPLSAALTTPGARVWLAWPLP